MARPTKYDEKRAEAICKSLKDGATRRAASASAGVSDDSFGRWVKAYADFAERVTRAEADAENAMVLCIRKAARSDWRAAESWLKRRRRDEWGDNEKVTHDGSLEFLSAGAAEADSKFAAAVARSRANPVLGEPDRPGED